MAIKLAGHKELRRQGWVAVVEVPPSKRAAMGRKRLTKGLGTRDPREASALLPRALRLLHDQMDAAVAARPSSTGSLPIREGLAWREMLESADQHGGADALREQVAEAAEAMEVARGETAALEFYGIATGERTPLSAHLDAWLREGGKNGPYRARTAFQYRSDVNGFLAWLSAAGLSATVEAVTRKVVGRFISEALVTTGTDAKTSNRKISAASTYWRWLMKRGHAEANPWQGQSRTKVRRADGENARKRPFTDAEVKVLLAGDADQELADAMRIAALSGMRFEEIYRLRVKNCAGGWMEVRDGKSRASDRRVPIHPDLDGIIARRCAGVSPAAYLFPEPGDVKEGRERSMAASKRFGHYRKRMKVDDRPEGMRQSRVDFHSWRRWFITKAEQVGQPPHIISAVVGHEVGRQGMTLSTYSGGPSDEQKIACVKAVRLPTGTPS